MNNEEYIRQIDFDQVNDIIDVDYADEGFAFHTDIRELPIEEENMQIKMVTIVACTCGELQFELNAHPYALHKEEILVCRPNDLVAKCALSPDFQGAVLCFSPRGMLEQISECDIWKRFFSIVSNPIVQISGHSLRMFNMYGEALSEKINHRGTPFYQEIVVTLVKAALYELLSNIEDNPEETYGAGLIKQKEVLFKRFVELITTTQVKPRNVTWYADRLCVTPKYLSTICKQVSGKTAFDWINEYVSVDVRYWLKSSNKTIKEIADYLGFPNISFFGKYCRTHLGMSPSECRKMLRNIPTEKSTKH